jgi:hypothetical protein
MAVYLVLEDFDGSESFSAAQTVDGNVYDVQSLQAEGLAVIPYSPTQDGVIATFLTPTQATSPTAVAPTFTSLLLAAGLIGGGGGGSNIIWEWNGTDTTQFDPVVLSSTPASTLILGTSGPDLATNKTSTTLDVTAAWTSNTVAAYRVSPSEGLVLPERFRLRLGLSMVDYDHIRIGFLFFDPTTWGAGLLGGGMTYGNTFIQWILAAGAAAAIQPFTPQGPTANFCSTGYLDKFGGTLCEWDCTLRPGDAGNPPSVACYGSSLGSVNGDGYTVVADRGRLIGDGNLGGPTGAGLNGASLTGLAIVVNSNNAPGGVAKISRLQVLQPV